MEFNELLDLINGLQEAGIIEIVDEDSLIEVLEKFIEDSSPYNFDNE